MKCRKIEKKLSAFLDNELKEKERRKIREHLKICPLCTQKLRELSLIQKFVKELEGIEPSLYLWDNLLKRISSTKSLIRKRTFHILAPITATIILIVGILTGIYLGKTLYSESKSFVQEENVELLYLNTFNDLPPDSIGGIYTSLVSQGW